MSLNNEWFKKWKHKNGFVRYKIGLINKFVLDYAEQSELEYIATKHNRIKKSAENSNGRSWHWRYALSSLYRDYRVILRARHALSFDTDQIYKCYGSGCYADVLEGKFGKCTQPSYTKIEKGAVLMWVSRDVAQRNTFMYNNTMVRITGIALDKIRKIEEKDTQ